MMVLNAIDLEKRVTVIYIIGAFINVILNLVLIPKYSYNGSAYATLISVTLVFVILFSQILRTEFKPKIGLVFNLIKILIATAVMFLALFIFKLPMWCGVIVGVLIYGLMFFILRIIDDNDKYIFSHLIHKEK